MARPLIRFVTSSPLCGCLVPSRLCKFPVQRLSTGAAAQDPKDSNRIVELANSDPTKHSLDDYLKYYSIDKNFIQTALNNSIPKKFRDLSNVLGEYNLMLRKPSLRIIEQLEKEDKPKQHKFILHGPQGSGKSLSLLHILHYASMRDWQILYVPDGFRFIDSQGSTEIQPSQWRPGRFDQPKESLMWLSNFRQLNLQFLQKNHTTADYNWGKRESTEKGCPLIDVVHQGIGRSMYAADAVGVLLKELRTVPERKILLAIDRFNGIFSDTSHKINEKLVDRKDLSLVHHFNKLLTPEYSLGNNSAYVFALSSKGQYMKSQNSDPIDGVNEKIMEKFDDFTKVKISNYNEREFETIIDLYKSKRWIGREPTPNIIKELGFLTGKNPQSIVKYSTML